MGEASQKIRKMRKGICLNLRRRGEVQRREPLRIRRLGMKRVVA